MKNNKEVIWFFTYKIAAKYLKNQEKFFCKNLPLFIHKEVTNIRTT